MKIMHTHFIITMWTKTCVKQYKWCVHVCVLAGGRYAGGRYVLCTNNQLFDYDRKRAHCPCVMSLPVPYMCMCLFLQHVGISYALTSTLLLLDNSQPFFHATCVFGCLRNADEDIYQNTPKTSWIHKCSYIRLVSCQPANYSPLTFL